MCTLWPSLFNTVICAICAMCALRPSVINSAIVRDMRNVLRFSPVWLIQPICAMCTIQPSVVNAAIMCDIRNVYDTAQCD